MNLTKDIIKDICDDVNLQSKRKLRAEDYSRYLMFNGKTHEIIKAAISKEFSKPETVEELCSRIVPINITQKIVTKLAGVYTESPLRKASNQDQQDNMLVGEYEEYLSLNLRMKEANRYFKLYKRNLSELYVDEMGCPWIRNIPRHQYEVYSFSALTPNRPDVIVKIIKDHINRSEQVFHIWSNENFVVVDGDGNILIQKMQENTSGINPYGKMPFVYINESSDSVDPLADDDLLKMSITIPVVLTDLLFANKYQCFSLIYTIGYDGVVPSNPNSVVPMQIGKDGERPEIGTIEPKVDSDKVISIVTTLLSMLLTTKSLSSKTISPISSDNAASGVALILDNAESVEDKKDQQEFFRKAETDMWSLLSKHMIPYWRATGQIKPELNQEFSEDFEITVFFREPKVITSEKEQIELSTLRIESGFSTLKRELAMLYPQMSDEEILDLMNEIREEKQSNMDRAVGAIDGEVQPEDGTQSNNFGEQ